jgi:hypothetical protein
LQLVVVQPGFDVICECILWKVNITAKEQSSGITVSRFPAGLVCCCGDMNTTVVHVCRRWVQLLLEAAI